MGFYKNDTIYIKVGGIHLHDRLKFTNMARNINISFTHELGNSVTIIKMYIILY